MEPAIATDHMDEGEAGEVEQQQQQQQQEEDAKNPYSSVLDLRELGETITIDESSDETAQRVEQEIRAYDSAVCTILEGKLGWSPENMERVLIGLTKQLENLDDCTEKPLAEGYVGLKVLPHVTAMLLRSYNNLLPKFHRLTPECVDQYIIDVGKALDPERFGNTHLRLINFADLLDPEAAARLFQPISDETASWLCANAQDRLRALQEKAPELIPNLSDEDIRTLQNDLVFLRDASEGRFSAGFNIGSETRWELCTHEFLLDSRLGDLRATDKRISSEQHRYLMRLARRALSDIEYHRKENSERVEELETQYKHLKQIVETGQLPYGYHDAGSAYGSASAPETTAAAPPPNTQTE